MISAMEAQPIIGVGVYSVPEASRLTGIPPARIRRWLRGYEFNNRGTHRRSAPVWRAQLAPVDETMALGFLDLMEIRFVDGFLKAGLSLAKIRAAAKVATELVGRNHPFSTQKFKTDGKRIFAELQHRESGDKAMLDLERSQFGIYEFIVPSLMKGIEFDEQGQAARWHPLASEAPLVVVDPERQFGQPVIETAGVQTSAIVDAWKAEGSVDAVARWFEIPCNAVEQAITFEFKLAA
jgi:uncharacterized protein (DUF433 family)/DNA-binding transcriptional MerR regulator